MSNIESQSNDEAVSLSEELSILTRQQYEALRKWSYVRMAQSLRDDYDRRRLRIGEICDLFRKSAQSADAQTPYKK
jgi:hypothetical protein